MLLFKSAVLVINIVVPKCLKNVCRNAYQVGFKCMVKLWGDHVSVIILFCFYVLLYTQHTYVLYLTI